MGSEKLSRTDCLIAISCGGRVTGSVGVGAGKATENTLAEWAADPKVNAIVRVPTEVARKYIFEKWPGRDAAIAMARPAGRSALSTTTKGEGDE